MKRTTLNLAVLLFAATSLHAQSQPQSLAGTWQGTLPIAATGQGSTGGNGVRIIFTVDKKPDGSLHGAMNLIDLGNSATLTSVSLSATNVTFALGDAACIFRGKLSTDGHTIAGTWGQRPANLAAHPHARLRRHSLAPRGSLRAAHGRQCRPLLRGRHH